MRSRSIPLEMEKNSSPAAEEALSVTVGRATVAEHLDRAVEDGHLVQNGDTTWHLRESDPEGVATWVMGGRRWQVPCHKLVRVVFTYAYNKSAVPWTCRNCFKVKFQPRTMREHIALYELLKGESNTYKIGTEFENRYSSGIYAAYIYADGLGEARGIYARYRDTVASHPNLGPALPMLIKRGCTLYEVHCGPSNAYTFDSALNGVEAYLMDRITLAVPTALPRPVVLMNWMQVAYQSGDDTYLDFTHGRPLHRQVVNYAP